MAYYLSLDSGGTKVAAILYDENLSPLRFARVGSMRETTVDPKLIERHADDLIEQLGIQEGMVIEKLAGASYSDVVFKEKLRKLCTIKQNFCTGEYEVGMYAAGIFHGGILALSGTGSDVFGKYGENNKYNALVGGYGSLVSDEGSGYWMARMACEYAIRDFEGRGEKTMLTELIPQQMKKESLRSALISVYSLPNTAPTTAVASLSRTIDTAALAGDAVALRIIDAAAKAMADQTLVLFKQYDFPIEVPITISGSAWKSPGMFEKFEKRLKEYNENLNITLPEFEPIMGPIIKDYYDKYGKFDEEAKEKFRREYSDYLFKIKK
ncbi:MAG: hypothetical protein E7658_06795 [Ruminococcaceae bacterium]|nr:hypothetical protein [Oscillospiraceae bacterium]